MPSAIILGGGIAGSAAGLALVQAGWEVRIYERAARLEAVGGALSIWPNAITALARLEVVDAVRRRGMPFSSMLVADRVGRPIIPARRVDGEAMLVTRSDLLDALVDALPSDTLVLGREVEQVEEHASEAMLRFAGGQIAEADLIVDAGGLRSVAAEPDAVSYRGYGGVVAISDPVDEAGLGGLAAEYWGWGERFGLFELTGDRRYWFFMRDQSAEAGPPSHDEIATRALRFPPAIGRAVGSTPPERLIPFSIHARAAPRTLGRGRILAAAGRRSRDGLIRGFGILRRSLPPVMVAQMVLGAFGLLAAVGFEAFGSRMLPMPGTVRTCSSWPRSPSARACGRRSRRWHSCGA